MAHAEMAGVAGILLVAVVVGAPPWGAAVLAAAIMVVEWGKRR